VAYPLVPCLSRCCLSRLCVVDFSFFFHPESTGELVLLLRGLPCAVEINSRVQTETESISLFFLQIAQHYCAVTTTTTTTTTVVLKLAQMQKAQTRNADIKNNNEVCITTPYSYHRRLFNGQKYGEQNHITATTNRRRSPVQKTAVTEKKGDCLQL